MAIIPTMILSATCQTGSDGVNAIGQLIAPNTPIRIKIIPMIYSNHLTTIITPYTFWPCKTYIEII